jgi:hypothetical protein
MITQTDIDWIVMIAPFAILLSEDDFMEDSK